MLRNRSAILTQDNLYLKSLRRLASRVENGKPRRGTAELIGVALLIVISAALSISWALRVPPFMMPDEVAHADYAFAFFDAGHPFRLSSSAPSNFVMRQTRYLIDASGYRRLRYNIDAIRIADLSDAAVRTRVDRGAPSRSGHTPRDGDPLPYAMLSYPAPYYAVVASAMMIGWQFSHHSIIAAFFFGRLVNVAYLMGTLLFAYAILAQTNLTPLQRRLIFVALAFLPMSDWMSGYIQPDNQTSLLASMAIYFGLRVRREPTVVTHSLALAAAECGLAFTKLHYAAVLIVATYLALRAAYAKLAPLKRTTLVIVAFGLPILALAIAQITLPAGAFRGASISDAYAKQTTLALLIHAGKLIADEAAATYLGGSVFDGFWFQFGLRAGSAFGGSGNFQTALRFALICATATSLSTVFIRQICVIRRLWRLTRRRGLAASLTFLGNDVHLNTYVLLTLLLFALSAAADGYLTLQARYWSPILTSTFLLGVSSLGLSNRGRRQRIAINIGCITLAVSALALAPASLFAMNTEFYSARPPTTTRELGEISNVRIGSQVLSLKNVIVPQRVSFRISGVALDGEEGREARDVRVRVDGGETVRANTGERASRLAILFNDWTLGRAGFSAEISTDRLVPGEHELSVTSIEHRARNGLPIATMSFSVTAPHRHSP